MRINLHNGKECNLLPLLSLQYFCLSVLLVVVALGVIEFAVLPFLEEQGFVTTEGWLQYDEDVKGAIYERTYAPRLGDGDEVWRTDAYPVNEKCPKSKRILVMGDSFVWGDGAANVNELWWRQLAFELRRRGYNDVEVIASGVDAANTFWELKNGMRAWKKYKPDMIIWGYVANDPDEGAVKRAFVYWDDPQFEPIYSCIRSFLPRLAGQLFFRRVVTRFKKDSNPTVGYDYEDWEDHLAEPENLAKYEHTVAQLGDFCRQNHIPTFVLALPYRPLSERFHRLFGAVKPLFTRHGLDFIDPTDRCVAYCDDVSHHARFFGSIPGTVINPANPSHPGPWLTYSLGSTAASVLEQDFRNILGQRSVIPAPQEAVYNDLAPDNVNLRRIAHDQVELTYPPTNKLLPMPGRRPYLQLNLEEPTPIESVEISGPGISSARLYVSSENPKKFLFDNDIFDLGQGVKTRSGNIDFAKAETSIKWSFPATAQWRDTVDTLRIAVVFGYISNRRLTVKVIVPPRK